MAIFKTYVKDRGGRKTPLEKEVSLILRVATCFLIILVMAYLEDIGDLVPDHWNEAKVKVVQSCLTLCDPMNYIVHRVLQARILEWVAFPFSSRSSQPRDRTQVSCIAGRFFTIWATREAFQPDYNPLPSAWFPSKASTRLDVGSLYSSFRLLLLLVYLLVLLSCFLHFL